MTSRAMLSPARFAWVLLHAAANMGQTVATTGSTWESTGAIEGFAGHDSEAAVVPEKVWEMMLEYDHRVRHYEVLP